MSNSPIDYKHYKKSNFIESKKRFIERFKKNKIKINLNKKDKVLIFGTINYFLAVKSLGSLNIEAADIGSRPSFLPKKIKYKKIFNKKLPYKDKNFKFIFCNGILSHLPYFENYIKEIYRTLDNNGIAWINVYGESKLEDLKYRVAKKFNKVDLINFKKILSYHEWNAGKINFILSLLNRHNHYVFNKFKLESIFKKNKFSKFKFCLRGYKSDLSEQIYKNKKLKKIFNYGDLRYILYKKQ